MSACNPHGKVLELAKFPSNSTIRFFSVFECPVVPAAMNLYIKRAPQGGNYLAATSPGAPDDWPFLQTEEYKTLRFAMQSFPSKWFVFSIHHRHTLLIVTI